MLCSSCYQRGKHLGESEVSLTETPASQVANIPLTKHALGALQINLESSRRQLSNQNALRPSYAIALPSRVEHLLWETTYTDGHAQGSERPSGGLLLWAGAESARWQILRSTGCCFVRRSM